MKLSEVITNPSQVQPIEQRDYWSAPENIRTAEQITFEISHDESWSFPRAQLVRFTVEQTVIENPWNPKEQISGQAIIFEFPIAKIIVQSKYAVELLDAVLSGKISVLVRGPAVWKERIVPQQRNPKEFSATANFAFTGHIIPIYG